MNEPDTNLTDRVQQWISKVVSAARAANPSLKNFKGKLKSKYGLPERVRLTFPKHYVFVEKGVGRGRKIGSGKETPKAAINPAIEQNISELADIAADGMATVVAHKLFIK